MKNLKRIFALLFVLVFIFSATITASAEYDMTYNGSTYNNYSYWGKSASKQAYSTKPVFDTKKVTEFSNIGLDYDKLKLEMLAYDPQGNVYVIDSISGSIIVFDSNYEFKYHYKDFYYDIITILTYKELDLKTKIEELERMDG